jgi:hypothetical protein
VPFLPAVLNTYEIRQFSTFEGSSVHHRDMLASMAAELGANRCGKDHLPTSKYASDLQISIGMSWDPPLTPTIGGAAAHALALVSVTGGEHAEAP